MKITWDSSVLLTALLLFSSVAEGFTDGDSPFQLDSHTTLKTEIKRSPELPATVLARADAKKKTTTPAPAKKNTAPIAPAKKTTDTGKKTTDTGKKTTDTGKKTTDTGKKTTDTGKKKGPRVLCSAAKCGATACRDKIEKRDGILGQIEYRDASSTTSALPLERRFKNNAANANDYVKNQLVGPNRDPEFPEPERLIAKQNGRGTPANVAVQKDFGSENFQIGTNHVHGCTVVVAVSETSVYMSHIWEVEALRGKDTLDGRTQQAFKARVLDFLDGTSTAQSSPTLQKGIGPGIDATKFAAGTQAHIMTPLIENEATGTYGPGIQYPNKVAAIVGHIRPKLGNVEAVTRSYTPLDFDTDDNGNVVRDPAKPDSSIADTNAKGMVLFQYHAATGAWRLFIEERRFEGKKNTGGKKRK